MFYAKRRKYEVGTVVQHRNHYCYIKTDDKDWVSQHRWIAAQAGDVRGRTGDLQPGEKVFHLNGKKDDNHPKNLIRIQFDTTKYYVKHLPESRVLHVPKRQSRVSL
jgi:hypothetical protein